MARSLRKSALLAATLLSIVAAPVLAAAPVLRVERVDASHWPMIRAYVTLVGGSGAPIGGLAKDNFKVIELKTNEVDPKEVRTLQATGYGATIAIVVQNSGVYSGVIEDVKKSVSGYINGLTDKDQVAVVVYSDKVDVLAPLGDKAAAASAMSKLGEPGGQRLLFDGVASALGLFPVPGTVTMRKKDDPAGQPQARAIVVFGDGKDSGSSADIERLVAEAKKKLVPIFTIAHGADGEEGLATMEDLAGRATAPFAYVSAPAVEDFNKAFINVASKIGNQYVVEWKADDVPSDGGTHALEIRVEVGETKIVGSGTVTTPKYWNPMPWIITGVVLLLLIALGVFIYIKTRPEPIPPRICPVCSKEQLPDWDVCLFCLKSSNAQLVVVKGWAVNKKFPLVGKTIAIGKGQADPTQPADARAIRIPDTAVSTRHAGIQVDGTKFEVVDMGSSNGTFVNGKKVQRRFLGNGDILTIGQTQLKFETTITDSELGNFDDPE